ncbi:hypothetical protein vBAspATola_18 [Aeromonas phage vB_AspA_Tola]|nr:hypothetical protein vBAspATola_18 [Aeromonas phage vB_AspA_Tola]
MSKRKSVTNSLGDEIVYGVTKGQVKRQYRYILRRKGTRGSSWFGPGGRH